jgi:hypothetical protein
MQNLADDHFGFFRTEETIPVIICNHMTGYVTYDDFQYNWKGMLWSL